MKITQEGDRVRLQLVQTSDKPRLGAGYQEPKLLADFRINKDDYPELRKHIIKALNEFNPTLDDIKEIKI